MIAPFFLPAWLAARVSKRSAVADVCIIQFVVCIIQAIIVDTLVSICYIDTMY